MKILVNSDGSVTINESQETEGTLIQYGEKNILLLNGEINSGAPIPDPKKQIDPRFLMEMKATRESVMETVGVLPYNIGYQTEIETLLIMYDQAFEFLKEFSSGFPEIEPEKEPEVAEGAPVPVEDTVKQYPLRTDEALPAEPVTEEPPQEAHDPADPSRLRCTYNNEEYILTPRGFVFVHTSGRPYWICLFHGRARMYFWKDKKEWALYQEPVPMDTIINMAKRSIPDSHAELYHKQHRKLTGSTEFPPPQL